RRRQRLPPAQDPARQGPGRRARSLRNAPGGSEMSPRALAAASLALAISSALAVSIARAQDPPPAPPAPPPPPAEARDIVQGACTACHGLDCIREPHKDRERCA